jgi:hypothetical protein
MRSKAGKHLIIEKRVALGLAGLQRLRATVDATGVKNDRQFRAEMESTLSGDPVAARFWIPPTPCSTPQSAIPSHIMMALEARKLPWLRLSY